MKDGEPRDESSASIEDDLSVVLSLLLRPVVVGKSIGFPASVSWNPIQPIVDIQRQLVKVELWLLGDEFVGHVIKAMRSKYGGGWRGQLGSDVRTATSY